MKYRHNNIFTDQRMYMQQPLHRTNIASVLPPYNLTLSKTYAKHLYIRISSRQKQPADILRNISFLCPFRLTELYNQNNYHVFNLTDSSFYALSGLQSYITRIYTGRTDSALLVSMPFRAYRIT